jgi:hypothetical protein
VIDSVRPLAETAAAHERLESGAHFGKLVLDIGRARSSSVSARPISLAGSGPGRSPLSKS